MFFLANWDSKNIRENGSKLMFFINVLSTKPIISPYISKTGTRKHCDDEWKNRLFSLNQRLASIFYSNKDALLSLASKYQEIESEDSDLYKILPNNSFYIIVNDFALGVDRIKRETIPKIIDTSIKLKILEDKYQIKSRAEWLLGSSIFIFIVGIFLPLIIHLYCNPPNPKGFQTLILTTTLLPYFCFLLWLLTKVVPLKIK